MLKPFFTAALLLAAPAALADHDSLGTITGPEIDLKIHDHAIAGSIHNFVLFGTTDEQTFTGELTMKRDGQLVRATFAKTDAGPIGGVISQELDGAAKETAVWFTRLDRPTNTYYLTVNGAEATVRVEAEDFQNNHFINPTYHAALADGRTVAFKLNGEACYSFSLHLIFQVLGAWAH